MRTSLAFRIYSKKYMYIGEYFLALFGKKKFSITLVNGGQLLLSELGGGQ